MEAMNSAALKAHACCARTLLRPVRIARRRSRRRGKGCRGCRCEASCKASQGPQHDTPLTHSCSLIMLLVLRNIHRHARNAVQRHQLT